MGFKWYIANVVSGQEQGICEEINRIATKNENIEKAFVPMKKVAKIKRGKKVETLQKLFPGYVFVHLDANVGVLDTIRAIPKVSGFLGSKIKPKVVSDSEINSILDKIEKQESQAEKVQFEIGDTVKIIEGSFESFTGTVEGKDENKNILKVAVSIFGRPTVVDLDVSKVEKI